MPFWATTFLCMAALAGQQWARPVRHDVCAPQCGGVCHEAASADGDAAHDQAAAPQNVFKLSAYAYNAQFFLTKLKKSGRETKKLKIDPGSVSGACLCPLIDKKVFQQLVINLK